MAPNPMQPLLDQMHHMVWTVIVPCIILAGIVGLGIEVARYGFEGWLTRWIRKRRERRRRGK
jgi:uncharacterized protein (DUF2062 family)